MAVAELRVAKAAKELSKTFGDKVEGTARNEVLGKFAFKLGETRAGSSTLS